MAKYHIVPGGRTDRVVQGAKRAGKATVEGAGVGATMGLMGGANLGPANALGAAAVLGGITGVATGVGSLISQVSNRHNALSKNQFKK